VVRARFSGRALPVKGDPGDDGRPDAPAVVGPGDPCGAAADPFDPAALQRGVAYLASDAMGGRASGTPGDLATRAYIAAAFACIGLVPGGDAGGFEQAFVAPDGTAAANVVGYLPGSDPALAAEVIVVGAHHDYLGVSAGGKIYNGANDNASGVIALLAEARALAATRPARTIAFVTFGYEEHVGRCEGSTYFAAHTPPALAIDRTIYMLDLDMVGTYPLATKLTAYGTKHSTKGRSILDALAPSYADLTIEHAGDPIATTPTSRRSRTTPSVRLLRDRRRRVRRRSVRRRRAPRLREHVADRTPRVRRRGHARARRRALIFSTARMRSLFALLVGAGCGFHGSGSNATTTARAAPTRWRRGARPARMPARSTRS